MSLKEKMDIIYFCKGKHFTEMFRAKRFKYMTVYSYCIQPHVQTGHNKSSYRTQSALLDTGAVLSCGAA